VAPSASFSLRISWPHRERDGIEAREGLVVEHQHRIEHHGAGERRPPRHAAGQLAGISRCAPRSPTLSSFIRTRSRIMPSGSWVCSRSGNATFSNTVMSVKRAPN
jgi:hypothetical protein